MATVRPLITQPEIAQAVRQLGEKLTAQYRGKDLTVLGVLTGSIVLVTDLMREIKTPHQLGLVQASSYRGTATAPAELRINLDFLPSLKDRHVLVVDDIYDTGKTLTEILARLNAFEPRSLQTAVLLWKRARMQIGSGPDYYCFDIPDEFVVGYGLDFNGHYRHLPEIGVLENLEEDSG